MAEAYRHVAHGPIRNRGTLCGNLCHADPASEMPAVVLATDGVMVLKSSGGERRVPADEFFRGIYETAAKPDELLVEVRIPVASDKHGWGFQEISVRKGDFALVGVAATLKSRKARFQKPLSQYVVWASARDGCGRWRLFCCKLHPARTRSRRPGRLPLPAWNRSSVLTRMQPIGETLCAY